MNNYRLMLPDDFDDYAWEIESKGWFNAIAEFGGARYKISFYDPVRLLQDAEDELNKHPAFYESNLLVLKSVERTHMEKAIEYLANTRKYINMVRQKNV